MRFLYKPIINKKQIGQKRKYSDIKYLVIHDTGNTSIGADAEAHYKYLQTATRYGSAHYYVDDKQIIQTIGDSLVAWSIGDTWGYSNNPNRIKDAFNFNSLNVELCINANIDKDKAYKNVVELTKNLMKKFGFTADMVIRHFDATGKICPGSWSKNDWAKWWQFKEDIQKPIEWTIDLTKDSEFGEDEKMEKKSNASDWADTAWKWGIEKGLTDGTNPKGQCTREQVVTMLYRAMGNGKAVEKPAVSGKAKHFTMGDYEIIETTADNIRIERTSLKPLSVDGINGTFYNLRGSEIYGLAMQDGKEIETNSYVTNFQGLKRGAIYFDGKSLHHAMVYNARTEIKEPIKWGISGISLYPIYDPKAEGFTGAYADVLRSTKHTAIGFKGDKVYLIASGKALPLDSFRNGLLNSSISFDGLINLDGGGSTQMNFGGKKLISSVRALNHCIRLVTI